MWSQLYLTSCLPFSSPRRWFSIQNSQLVYQKKLKVHGKGVFLFGQTPPHLDYGFGYLVDVGTGLVIQTGTKKSGEQGVRDTLPESKMEEERCMRAVNLSCPQDALTVVVDDLRLCSVKPCEDIERRFCFEVVSPTK